MPDLFYPDEDPDVMPAGQDRPIILRRFIVYIVAPVFATELVLGRYLDHLFEASYDPWPRHSVGYPFRAGPHIQASYNFIEQSRDVLSPEIYRDTYFV